MSWRIKSGVTRIVLVTDRWAYKVPNVRRWHLFLRGLLANMAEKFWQGYSDKLCPVRTSLRGGFLNIMPRCEPLTDTQWDQVRDDMEKWDSLMAIDWKRANFGTLNGKVVLLDYGS